MHMTTGHNFCCKEFLCFNTMPCRHMPLLVHFWIRSPSVWKSIQDSNLWKPTNARNGARSLSEYLSTGYGLRFSTSIYGSEREKPVFDKYLQEYYFVLTEIFKIFWNLREFTGENNLGVLYSSSLLAPRVEDIDLLSGHLEGCDPRDAYDRVMRSSQPLRAVCAINDVDNNTTAY